MYVLFPISRARGAGAGATVLRPRAGLDARCSQAAAAGRHACTARPGKIDYVDPTGRRRAPTPILLRATIPNPPRRPAEAGEPVDRALTDGEFVTVSVEGVEPVEALAIPRVAVLSDQQGNYVYVVDAAEQGASSAASRSASPRPTTAVGDQPG